jgi:hypothetical protein
MLHRQYEAESRLTPRQQAARLSFGGKVTVPCWQSSEIMNLLAENQVLTAFASNPECQGVKVVQGFYGPNDSDQVAARTFNSADWRLSLDLNPSAETGDIALAQSEWTINPRSLSGSLADTEKATTQICHIAKAAGAQ